MHNQYKLPSPDEPTTPQHNPVKRLTAMRDVWSRVVPLPLPADTPYDRSDQYEETTDAEIWANRNTKSSYHINLNRSSNEYTAKQQVGYKRPLHNIQVWPWSMAHKSINTLPYLGRIDDESLLLHLCERVPRSCVHVDLHHL